MMIDSENTEQTAFILSNRLLGTYTVYQSEGLETCCSLYRCSHSESRGNRR